MGFFDDLIKGPVPFWERKPKVGDPIREYVRPSHVHNSLPTWTTEGDLIKKCPGCNKMVVWPFTQDPFEELYLGRPPQLHKATEDELKVLQSIVPGCISAFSVGTKIKTLKTVTGKLWHEPCYLLAEIMDYRNYMIDVINILKVFTNERR